MDFARRLTIATALGLTGLAVMAAMVHAPASILHESTSIASGVWGSVMLGPMLAGGLLARFFGRPGAAGLWQAVVGAVLTTTLGAALCGVVIVLALPDAATTMLDHRPVGGLVTIMIWAPLLVLDSLLRSSTTTLVWVACIAIVQVLARHRNTPGRLKLPA